MTCNEAAASLQEPQSSLVFDYPQMLRINNSRVSNQAEKHLPCDLRDPALSGLLRKADFQDGLRHRSQHQLRHQRLLQQQQERRQRRIDIACDIDAVVASDTRPQRTL